MIQFTSPNRSVFSGSLAALLITLVAACAPSAPAPSAPPAAEAAPAAPAITITLIEPTDNSFSGHVDMFRWSVVEGADAYVLRILGSDGRVVFESPAQAATEARLPKTVAFEPESHTWTVAARKAGAVLVTSRASRFTVTP